MCGGFDDSGRNSNRNHYYGMDHNREQDCSHEIFGRGDLFDAFPYLKWTSAELIVFQ